LLRKFWSYTLAVELNRSCQGRLLPYFLKDQLMRAASSTVLNLSEGSARATAEDRAKFYNIAFASCREVQSIIDLEPTLDSLRGQADVLAAHLYKLARS
jgi:four helix bundle protein